MKRILSELDKFQKLKNQSEADGTPLQYYFLAPDETNISHLKALVIGPEGTPYHNMFLYFDIQCGNSYPFNPPTVKFLSPNGRDSMRIHPNLYGNGKVCLSILGTWVGPPWTALMTIEKILITILSILDNEPIKNEPGCERSSKADVEAYNNVARYRAFQCCLIDMLKDNDDMPNEFVYIIQRHFIKNFEIYMKEIETNGMHLQGSVVKSFHGGELIDYIHIKKELVNIARCAKSLRLFAPHS